MQKMLNQFLERIRVLPVLMLAVALLFGVKVESIWGGVSAFRAGVSEANAQAPAAPAAAVEQPASKDGEAAVETAKATDPNDISSMSDSEVALLQKLSERRQELELQSKKLDTRETMLAAAEKRVEERIAKLKEIEDSVAVLIERFDKQEEARLTKLVQVYGSMKAKSAAAIFDQLDMDVLLAVSQRMDEAKMAEILSKMTPDAAKKLTLEMAKQKKLPGVAG
jgi:flagellar motility protein MotE (MotC chaperone)